MEENYGFEFEPLMTKTIWNEDHDLDMLKRVKKSLRQHRKHEGYKMFKQWAEFLQNIGMEVGEIEDHLARLHDKCTPLIYGHPSGLGSPNGGHSRYYQMRAALADMYD